MDRDSSVGKVDFLFEEVEHESAQGFPRMAAAEVTPDPNFIPVRIHLLPRAAPLIPLDQQVI
jgi:hypothetical protein